MRIAFIVEKFPALTETFILNQVIGLIERGHEVTIYAHEQCQETSKVHPDVIKYNLLKYTLYTENIPRNYITRTIKGMYILLINLTQTKSIKSILYIILGSLNFLKYGRRAASLRLFYSAARLFKAPPYDIIHCQFGMYGNEGMVLRDIGAIQGKLITSFRGYDISWYIQEYGNHVYQQLFNRGDFFLTNCEFFRQRAIQLGCDSRKIVVHGSGIDCSRFQFKPRYLNSHRVLKIVTTGRLIEKKGIEYGIRAVAKVLSKYPDIEYNIIGKGGLQEYLQQLIDELKVGNKINLLGWKHQQEIIEILDDSDIFIAPSVTASDGNQDAPVNTLKEAMAMGLPVIATHHGGIPELVEDSVSGFLVPERDDGAIAEKIIYLIEHPQDWLQMGKAGRNYVVKNYDINQLNDELVEIYTQVSANRIRYQQMSPIHV